MNRNAAFCGVMRWSASGSRIGALVMGAAPSLKQDRVRHTLVSITVSGRHLVSVIRANGAGFPLSGDVESSD